MSETKKRLLLSKWETAREKERNHDEEVSGLRWEIEQLESALVDVKYWMHAAQFRPLWPLLRKVEDVLG